MGATEILKTRVTPDTKARVMEITQSEVLTEAVWLRRLVLRARDFTHTRARTEAVAAEIRKGDFRVEPGKSTLMATRGNIERGWRATSDILRAQGHPELAAQVRRFVEQMGPARTDKELIAHELQKRLLEHTEIVRHRVR
jgi:hypothetical protein